MQTPTVIQENTYTPAGPGAAVREEGVEEEEEVAAPSQKNKKGKAKTAKEERRVVEVDSDGNTAASDSDNEYLSRAEIVVRSKVNTVRVRAAKDSDLLVAKGELVELVLDTGASAPISSNKEDLFNYRRAKKGSRHVVEIADGVEGMDRDSQCVART